MISETPPMTAINRTPEDPATSSQLPGGNMKEAKNKKNKKILKNSQTFGFFGKEQIL